jgi:hypothetical protein
VTDLSSMPDKIHARRTKAQIDELRTALAVLVEGHRPLTVRHLFYLAVAQGLIEKTEDQYQNTIIRLVGVMREEWLDAEHNNKQPENTVIPFGSEYIVDAGRWIRKPPSYDGIEAALRDTAAFYRRDLWRDSPVNVIFICEKDAIAELVYRETAQWDVPLAVIRGMSSKTFLYQNAQAIDAMDKETHLYFLGDHDGAGDKIIDSAVARIRRYANTEKNILWAKIAVTEEQIERFSLPLRPPKKGDGARYAKGCVEIDALPPDELRATINAHIEQHVDPRARTILATAEQSERELMARIAGNLPTIQQWLDERA